jgi:hypothetical protein
VTNVGFRRGFRGRRFGREFERFEGRRFGRGFERFGDECCGEFEEECEFEFRLLLAELRGSGFTVSITTRGAVFCNQKVVGFEDDVVFTVNPEGCVRATCIERIDSIDF